MSKQHILLKALEKIEFGSITVQTPDGKQHQFAGTSAGPAANWQVNDWQVFPEIVAHGEIGFAESYIDKRWSSNDLAQLIQFFMLNFPALERFFRGNPLHAIGTRLRYWLSLNSLTGSRRNIKQHYDLGNDFYSLWLDNSMTYSCAMFDGDGDRSLEAAQQAKYERILRKLKVEPGAHILEIGCGWGGFAEAAARKGMRVTAITLSQEQADYARMRLERQGLDNLAKVELKDYRNVEGKFDRIVSIGMFEHVGKQYWQTYFGIIRKLLKPDGRAMVQSITLDDDLYEKLGNSTGFIEKYIFPGGFLPSKRRFREAVSNAGLECREIYPFGKDYARTLKCWWERFEANLEAVKGMGYDEHFIGIWRFYLASCIAAFSSKRTSVIQAELLPA